MIVLNLRVCVCVCFRSSLSETWGGKIDFWFFFRKNLITNARALWPNHNRYQYDISLIVQAVRLWRQRRGQNCPTGKDSSSDARRPRPQRTPSRIFVSFVSLVSLPQPQLSWLAFDHRFVRSYTHCCCCCCSYCSCSLRFQQQSTKRRRSRYDK